MALLFNPGSGPIGEGSGGWTNTHAKACEHAQEWFERMTAEGFTDIDIGQPYPEESDGGRWTFIFRHQVTGVEVKLEIHGLDDEDAYQKEYIFLPRIYWNGGSSSNPELDDFAAPGFEPVMTYARKKR